MNWFELAIEDRRLLVQQASTVSGINAKALEKDLWVTLVLLAVFKTTYAPSLHFKGGTSLSKAWQVIDRFSEDIDLSIDRSFYGFAEDLSFTQIRKLKRISSEFVSTDFKEALEMTLLEMGVPAQLFSVHATPIPETRIIYTGRLVQFNGIDFEIGIGGVAHNTHILHVKGFARDHFIIHQGFPAIHP
jgi:hypothetical protein